MMMRSEIAFRFSQLDFPCTARLPTSEMLLPSDTTNRKLFIEKDKTPCMDARS